MSGGLVVRPGTPADAAALARLRYRFRVELGTPNEADEAFVARCSAWMESRLGPGSSWRCWLAVEGAEVAAVLWLGLVDKVPNPVDEPEQHAYITNVYVVPERRDGGVGALLMDEAMAFCRDQGIDTILLWPSAKSRSFYARYGFAPSSDVMARRLRLS
ncbi:MAG TPA: GNAT family N-acetyltransferase [Thermoanaerobaculia bacterium]|nr:GNAT family N-acetyltransferase [Thermoanaerobaculia bacterium]